MAPAGDSGLTRAAGPIGFPAPGGPRKGPRGSARARVGGFHRGHRAPLGAIGVHQTGPGFTGVGRGPGTAVGTGLPRGPPGSHSGGRPGSTGVGSGGEQNSGVGRGLPWCPYRPCRGSWALGREPVNPWGAVGRVSRESPDSGGAESLSPQESGVRSADSGSERSGPSGQRGRAPRRPRRPEASAEALHSGGATTPRQRLRPPGLLATAAPPGSLDSRSEFHSRRSRPRQSVRSSASPPLDPAARHPTLGSSPGQEQQPDRRSGNRE